MEESVLSLIEQLPNLVVAVVALYWCAGIITKMLDHQTKLIDRLLDLAKRNETLAAAATPHTETNTHT